MEKLQELLKLDVSSYASKKQGLTYLSWANAWKEFIKVYPKATYIIKKGDSGVPCFGSDSIGYMCYTEVTVDDLTHEMWLPVMNGANKAMRTVTYKYKTRNGDKEVEPMTMFDVNKTVMRCLTKNLAMFGLGLYIYAGEDLPEDNTPVDPKSLFNDTSDKIVRQYIGSGKMLDNQRADLIKELDSGKLIACPNLVDALIKEYGALNA